MSNLTFGRLVGPDAKRDAVHMAVIPVTAGDYPLSPGQHVKMHNGKAVTGDWSSEYVGVIDPFLKCCVSPGERCWLFLYPGSISALRHEWSHPAFDAPHLALGTGPVTTGPVTLPAPPLPPAPSVAVDALTEIAVAKKYLQDFAKERRMNYSELLFLADGVVEACASAGYGGWRDVSCSFPDYDPDEFWSFYEVVRGVSVPRNHRGPLFSCYDGITDEFSR